VRCRSGLNGILGPLCDTLRAQTDKGVASCSNGDNMVKGKESLAVLTCA